MGIVYTDVSGFVITWDKTRLAEVDNWIVTVTKPNSTKIVLDENTTSASILGAVLQPNLNMLASKDTNSLTYKSTELGTWWFQVSACFADHRRYRAADPPNPDTCPSDQLVAGTSVGYTHGAPAAPKGFTATLVPPMGVAIIWTPVKGDRGISGYEYTMDAWKTKKDLDTSGSMVVQDVKAGEHTFMLRAVGTSDNDTSTMEGSSIPGMAATATVTVPMSTPTLPEIAALFLAMLLLGSGAYLLRRRQSGGLTPA